MLRPTLRVPKSAFRMLIVVAALHGAGACTPTSGDGVAAADSAGASSEQADTARYRAEGDEGIGVSVVIVLDNSGSMGDRTEGDSRPKAVVARAAIEQALAATDAAIARRPDYPIKVGVVLFSDGVRTILPVRQYDRDSIRAALGRVPAPDGGTAIGDAMNAARQELYRAGTFRKVMLVVTDGENTSGRSPDAVAREIAARSEGGVGMYFIAFDTDPEKFGFLRTVRGDVVTAQNSRGLEASLSSLYESKVLAESATEPPPPAGAPTATPPAASH